MPRRVPPLQAKSWGWGQGGQINWHFLSIQTKNLNRSGLKDIINYVLKHWWTRHFVAVIQLLNLCPTFWDPMNCSTPGFPVLPHLPEFAQTHVHWVSDVIQPSHLLSSPSPPTFNLSQHQRLPSVSSSHQIAEVLEFQLQHHFFQQYSGLISLRIDWFDFLAVQEILKSLLQHHSWKPSVLQCSAFFMIQLSHQYMTTEKTTALSIWTFVSRVMSLLFNLLSRSVMASLSRSKRLNFTAIVTICSDSGVKIKSLFPLFPHLFAIRWRDWMPWS